MTTGSKLVIVESPAKAKKIGGYLGKEYRVLASVGHIRDLAQPSQVPADKKAQFGRFGVDVDDGFRPYYVVGADKRKTVAELRAALKDADELFLATDEDREGEAIAWHLVQTLKPKVPVKRMVFHEITPEAIRASLDHTREVDGNMVDAQETRRVLDRLYGYELSPVLWRKVGPGLSAGRVQSVATRLIVERERERMAFVRAPYWDVVATLQAPDALGALTDFEARLATLDGHRVAGSKDFTDGGTLTDAAVRDAVARLDAAAADRLADDLADAVFRTVSLETKPYRRRPLPPFTTSTLQQAAGNRLGMSSRQTMRAAQSLYENGYITYMRTDSVTLSHEAIVAARDSVERRFGHQYLSDGPRQYATKTAGAQEAHECIRPAGAHFRDPDQVASSLPPDQLKLYTLIWQRTLASQMADATGSTATARFAAPSSQGEAVFQTSGTVIEFPGFLRVFGDHRKGGTRDDDNALPPLTEGQGLTAVQVHADGHETQPPARYTEASLVKTLEAKEIGRPSTYASIISTIIDRGYVYERGRALIPSWLAFAVTKLLETKFPKLVDYQFTADMEHGLDQIAHGHETGREWLTAFYFGTGKDAARDAQDVHEGLQQQVAQLGEIDARAINTIEIGDGINVRVGRYGPYLEDTAHVDAEGNPRRASIPDTVAPDELTVDEARKLIESNAGGPRVLGTDPATGGTVEVRSGRFGPYVALVSAGDQDAKPRMASLFKSMAPETLTLEDALRLLSLPREVGSYEDTDPKTGNTSTVSVTASNGRYGPYLTRHAADGSTDTRSLGSEDEIFTVTIDQARDLFAQPKYGRRRGTAKPPLREFGPDPVSGKPVTIKEGFYGPYVTDGETNKSLPKQVDPKTVTAEDAFRMLAEKRAAGPAKRRGRKGSTKATKATGKTAKTAKAKAAKASTRKATAKPNAAEAARAERRAKVRDLADQGWANTRIARELGTTPATVKKDVDYLTEHDGYRRPPVIPAR